MHLRGGSELKTVWENSSELFFLAYFRFSYIPLGRVLIENKFLFSSLKNGLSDPQQNKENNQRHRYQGKLQARDFYRDAM